MIKRRQLQAIGRRIYDARKQKKLTQADVAEKSNLTTNYVGRIERGEAQPTLDALLAIAEALKINPSSVFAYLDQPLDKDEIKDRIKTLLEQI